MIQQLFKGKKGVRLCIELCFWKNKEILFRYCLGEGVYTISGLYRFLFGQQDSYKLTSMYTNAKHTPPSSRGF